jgi:hypothetical protein
MKTGDFSQYDPSLRHAIKTSVARICAELEQSMPLTAAQVGEWMKQLAGSVDPSDYYLRASASPMFLFPWYLEQTLRPNPEPSFQADLVDSTVNGYYYIRLIDNLTDGHATVELKLLPLLGFFHTRFQLPYQKYFEHGHAFWDLFARVWFHSADVTMSDLNLASIEPDSFMQVVAQKTCAVKIPLAAVCYKYQRLDRIAPWSRFMNVFGCWQQMLNDLLHWNEDLSLGATTYFLSEARRRKRSTDSITDWAIREGFQWGLGVLDQWMTEAQGLARDLDSLQLSGYLMYRKALLGRQGKHTLEALQLASKLGDLVILDDR